MFIRSIPLAKRMFDLLLAVLGLLILSPVLLLMAVLVGIYHGSPVLFTQTRPGFKGKPFCIYKFRTMTDARDEQGNLLPDSQRLTPLGRFLRASSLDELPELFNVLRGEMSIVGPRPLLMQYLERYTAEQARRHEVLPGITGWAQVNGLRGDTSIEERTRYDLYYIENWSLLFDIKIILRTIVNFITGRQENAY